MARPVKLKDYLGTLNVAGSVNHPGFAGGHLV